MTSFDLFPVPVRSGVKSNQRILSFTGYDVKIICTENHCIKSVSDNVMSMIKSQTVVDQEIMKRN